MLAVQRLSSNPGLEKTSLFLFSVLAEHHSVALHLGRSAVALGKAAQRQAQPRNHPAAEAWYASRCPGSPRTVPARKILGLQHPVSDTNFDGRYLAQTGQRPRG